MQQKVLIGSVCALLLVMTTHAQHQLDLTTVHAKPHANQGAIEVSSPGASGSEREIVSALPLDIRLDSLPVNKVVVGNAIVCVVSLANTGAYTVTLPWSGDSDADSASGRDPERTLHVSLQAEDAVGHEHRLGSFSLYGWDTIPETVLSLGPGEAARIRARVWITLNKASADDLRLTTDGTLVQVRAEARLSERPGHWAKPIYSLQTIPLTLKGFKGRLK